jgi:hypothetical protein
VPKRIVVPRSSCLPKGHFVLPWNGLRLCWELSEANYGLCWYCTLQEWRSLGTRCYRVPRTPQQYRKTDIVFLLFASVKNFQFSIGFRKCVVLPHPLTNIDWAVSCCANEIARLKVFIFINFGYHPNRDWRQLIHAIPRAKLIY